MKNGTAALQAALGRTRVTSAWPEKAIDEICAGAELKNYACGERVVSAGDTVDTAWIVTSGAFLLSRAWQNGRRFLYTYIRPGQSTGLLPVFDGEPAAFDVTARGGATTVVVPGGTLREVARAHSDVALDLIAYLCRRTRLDYEAVELHAMNSVRCRIAKTVLWIARGQPTTPSGEIVIDPKISQEDLADLVSAARQSVNRELGRLTREGILRQRYRTLVVLDPARLLDVASEDETISSVTYRRPAPLAANLYPTAD